MGAQPPRSTLIKLTKSKALIVHASAAIHTVTLRDERLASMRDAALAGFGYILDDQRLQIAILFKLYDKLDFSGDEEMFIAFKHDEMTILRECKKRLQTISGDPVDYKKAITMALMRVARPEFSREGLIEFPAAWFRNESLHT